VQNKYKAKKAKVDPSSLFSYGLLPTNKTALARWNARDDLRFISEKDSQVKCGAVAYARLEWVTENGYTYLKGVSKCKSPHTCPHCSPVQLAKKRSVINIKTAQNIDTGGMEAYGTFTIRPSDPKNLRQSYEELLAVGTKFRRLFAKIEKRYGITHSVRILEETYSESAFWHPHFNFIFHIPYLMREPDQNSFMDEVLDAWVHAAALAGVGKTSKAMQTLEYETDLTQALARNGYQTKHGRFPANKPVPGSNGKFAKLKPFDVLQLALTGDVYWIAVWNEFESATHRIRRIHFYKPRDKRKVPKVTDV
jgi:hypothetical protein